LDHGSSVTKEILKIKYQKYILEIRNFGNVSAIIVYNVHTYFCYH